MVGLIVTGIATFAATNIDDILILVMFFSQVTASFRSRHVVTGQYLGFATLVGVSLLGFLFSLVISSAWIGLLGFAPIVIGVRKFLDRNKPAEVTEAQSLSLEPRKPTVINALLAPYTYQVAVVTVANGADNIGIYTPLFATSSPAELGVLLVVFFVLLGVWCFAGFHLARRPAVVTLMTHYGHIIVPFVLIGLGIFILIESGTLSLFGL